MRVRKQQSHQNLKRLAAGLALALTTQTALAEDVQTILPANAANEHLLQPIRIKAKAGQATLAERYQLPQTTESTTAKQIMETVNMMDTEDAVKYMPSLFVRKRNYGDTQPVLATRTWGVNSSARSLVYADGVLLTALIANDNNNGAPRWGMVAPEEIDRIDVLYGPFSAAYSGNSMGAVMAITTRMPTKFEATLSETYAQQSYHDYGTNKNLPTTQTSALLGDRHGDLSYWVSVNHQDSHSQPVSIITAAATVPGTISAQPAATTGGFANAQNKLGQTAGVWGAGGLLHTLMDNFKLKTAYDFSPTVTANYTFGAWTNNGYSDVQTYLNSATTGTPSYGNVNGFAANTYNLDEQHSMHSLTAKSDTHGVFDWEAVASLYRYDKDMKVNPLTVVAGTTSFNPAGSMTDMSGTGWNNMDLKGVWRPDGKPGVHQISFGVHRNAEQLSTVTSNTANWTMPAPTTLISVGKGNTLTDALWLQDAWKFAPGLKATIGGRFEQWQANNGYNYSSTGLTSLAQPNRRDSNFSPKASLAWNANSDWLVTGSLGQATRYPTVTELYQLVTVGATLINPDPKLLPEQATSAEVAFERGLDDGKLRLSLFREEVSNALISQTNIVAGSATAVSFVSNVDKVRNQGAELSYRKNHVFVMPLEIQGSVTYVDSRILADSGWKPSGAAGVPVVNSVVGMHAPYVPALRATLATTWHSSDQLATTLAVRYSGRQYSTLDNTDVTSNVMGAFDSFVVADIRTQYKFDKNWTGAAGIDNVFNNKYYLYHPFPQRTFIATLKYTY
jgi:iron complex outermembrane receptor protein